jgi:DNA polymerase-1
VGAILTIDMSQIELRVPVLWCGEPNLLAVFKAGGNLHQMTGSSLAGFEINKKEHPRWYDCGKHANFLRVYGGEEAKLRETITGITGEFRSPAFCRAWIEQDRKRYPTLYEWQEALLAQAARMHRLAIPVVGISRSFRGPLALWRREALNFPVQAVAALLTQSAQIAVARTLREQGLRSLGLLNRHDESKYDCPDDEVERVRETALRWFRQPPIYEKLLASGMHDCPLDAEVTVAYNPPGYAVETPKAR